MSGTSPVPRIGSSGGIGFGVGTGAFVDAAPSPSANALPAANAPPATMKPLLVNLSSMPSSLSIKSHGRPRVEKARYLAFRGNFVAYISLDGKSPYARTRLYVLGHDRESVARNDGAAEPGGRN